MLKWGVFIFFLFLCSVEVFCQQNSRENISNCEIFLPKVISEETLELHFNTSCQITSFNFSIFSSEGKLLYKTDSIVPPIYFKPHSRFIGHKGVEYNYPEGSYFWLSEYCLPSNPEKKNTKTGSFVILR